MANRSHPRSRGLRLSSLGLTILALLLGLTACASDSGDEGGELRVAAVLPLTGPAAEIGAAWKAGIELAEDVINDNGGLTIDGKKVDIKVKIVDDESTPAGAQRVIQELLNEDYQLFFGPSTSANFQTAFATLKDDERRLVLSPAQAAEPFLTEGGRLFKTNPSQSPEAVARIAQQFADYLKPQTVAILQQQDPGGDDVAQNLAKGFEEAGVEVVYNNQVPADTRDFLPIVSAIRNTDPDLVITPVLDSVGGPFLQQAAQVGYVDTKFASYGGSSAQVAEAPEISEFTYMLATRAPDNPDDEVVADFRAAYEEKFGHEPKPIDTYALLVYDPLLMLAQAVEDAGTSTDIAAISTALREVTDWNGKALPFSFDEKGLIQLETMQLATLRDGVTTYTDFVR